MVTQLFKIKMK